MTWKPVCKTIIPPITNLEHLRTFRLVKKTQMDLYVQGQNLPGVHGQTFKQYFHDKILTSLIFKIIYGQK
jgi:hypothetical protein